MASSIIGTSAAEFSAQALRLLGVIDPEEQLRPRELDNCWAALNQMVDAWQADGYMIYTREIRDFPLSAKKSYTMGPGGDFDIDRPPDIGNQVSILMLANPLQPLEYVIPIYTTQDWQEKVPVKDIVSNLPVLIYDDGGFPQRTLTLWPIPQDNLNIRFYLPKLLQRFAGRNTRYAFPPGYAECIKYNLAVRVAPEFQTSASAEVALMAMNSLAVVKSSNPDDTQLRCDITRSSMTGAQMRAELFGIPSI